MIKINADGNDIKMLLKNFANDIAVYEDGEVKVVGKKLSLKNVDLKLQVNYDGLAGNVDCRLKNDNLEVNVGLNA